MKKSVKMFLCAVMALSFAVTVSAAKGVPEGWTASYPAAMQQANKQNKIMLMLFTGSDWCPACKALAKNLIHTKDFNEYAKKKLVLLYIDFPKYKQVEAAQRSANANLAEKYNIDAYPTIVLLKGDKRLSSFRGYEPSLFSKIKMVVEKSAAK